MKILHLLSSTGYDGAENMTATLIKQLSAFGIKNYLGVFYKNSSSNKYIFSVVNDYIEDGIIFPCHGKLDIRTILLVHKYIKDNHIDIIHSHKYKTNLYSFLAKFGTRCRLISTCHNWLGDNLKMRFYAILDKNLLRAFDIVVGVSDDVTKKLRCYVPIKKIKKIENGIDIQKYSRFIEKNEAKKVLGLEGNKVIGFVGRLTKAKGIDYLLEAVYKLLKEGDDFYTLIVGSGQYKSILETEARSMGIADKVIFTGNRKDTPLIYSALDVFVLPSLEEAFPMVILEAMAFGVPIVATQVGDIPLIIEDNGCGLLVKPKDVVALSRSIRALLHNEVETEKIINIATEVVNNRYSSVIMAQRYLDLYKQILS